MRARVTGRVEAPAAEELSGLVRSPTRRDVLWTHNDGGHPARLLAIARDGMLLADLAVTGAENVDWEDIAAGPAPRGGRALYIGDIGDNERRRATIAVYRVREPALDAAGATSTAEVLRLRYPDGPHDAEALLVDPASGAVAIVTKELSGGSGVYVARTARPGAVTTLRRSGRLRLGLAELVTAGDVSADGRTVALRTYTGLYVWRRRDGDSLAAALRRRPCARVRLAGEGQGETLALNAGGSRLQTVPEGRRPAMREYRPVRRSTSRPP